MNSKNYFVRSPDQTGTYTLSLTAGGNTSSVYAYGMILTPSVTGVSFSPLVDQGSTRLPTSLFTHEGTAGNEFSVSETTFLTGIWWFNPGNNANETNLPDACAIYDVSTQAIVPGSLNTSPDWAGSNGAWGGSGSGFSGAWNVCHYPGSVVLYPGKKYIVAVHSTPGVFGFNGAFPSSTTSGPASILTTGTIVTPSMFVTGSNIAYPTGNFNVAAGGSSGLVMAGVDVQVAAPYSTVYPFSPVFTESGTGTDTQTLPLKHILFTETGTGTDLARFFEYTKELTIDVAAMRLLDATLPVSIAAAAPLPRRGALTTDRWNFMYPWSK